MDTGERTLTTIVLDTGVVSELARTKMIEQCPTRTLTSRQQRDRNTDYFVFHAASDVVHMLLCDHIA